MNDIRDRETTFSWFSMKLLDMTQENTYVQV